MQVADLSRFLFILKVSVNEADSEEEGLIITLEIGKHLNHPVYHSSTQGWRDFVPHKTVIGEEFHFELSCVVKY